MHKIWYPGSVSRGPGWGAGWSVTRPGGPGWAAGAELSSAARPGPQSGQLTGAGKVSRAVWCGGLYWSAGGQPSREGPEQQQDVVRSEEDK